MWLLYFVNGFNQSLNGSLSAYVTSDFESHSLIPLISVVSSVMASATYMPLAKVLNLFDRSVGFAVMAGFATLGLVLTAVCNSIGTYCAAQVRLLELVLSITDIDRFPRYSTASVMQA